MGSQSASSKLPSLRFRGKVTLGFAVVLAITAVSMGTAYFGFERVSAGVATYRSSVSEADLARNIDRELISYRALARYYVVTGKEDDATAALAAEASLKDAIDRSMKGTANPARRDQVARLAGEFGTFSKLFADILKVKRDSALVTQNQLAKSGNMLRYKLDDLPSNADDSELQAIEFGAKKVTEQFQAVTALANTFVINSDQTVANSALARLKFVENSMRDHPVEGRKDRAGPERGRRAAGGIPAGADQTGREREVDRQAGGRDERIGRRDRQGRGRAEDRPVVRPEKT